MSEPEKKQRNLPPASKKNRQEKAVDEKGDDSADVERAVYDGMQDLRVKKPA